MNKFRDLWVVCRQHHDMGVVKLMSSSLREQTRERLTEAT